ncbi:MAG: hypothetical protein WC347_05310, partial [Smithellaceae bacterium]
YADIKKTKYSLFGSKKTSYSTQYQALDSEVSAMFDKVFQGMGQSLVYFAENLGTSVNDVMNYTFEQTKLDLKDMTAEEMNDAISGYISNISDNAVSALFGDMIGKYQELNEGLMETATRLIIDKEIVMSVMEDTGKSFAGTIPQMIAFSEQMIDIAGGLEELTDAAQTYIDKFYTDAEKFASTKESIRDVAGILPRTREDYRKLVESIDLTSEVGKQAYYTLMALSDTADSYYSHIEEIASQRADMEIELLEAQGKAEEALAARRKQELEAMDESLRPLQELIWLTEELGTSLETITTSVTTEINALISTSSSAASEARRMAQTYKGLIETLTEAQIKIFGGGKAGAQERFDDIYKLAMTGNSDALSKMPGAVDVLLSESLKTSKTEFEYRKDKGLALIRLEEAKTVSKAMVNWEEYHATLLETQVKVLEEMREDITNKNYAELQKHSELLENISTLLSEQTAQVVQGNTYVHDQTGKIIAGNTLVEQQTAQVVQGNTYVHDQTGKIIAGNTLVEQQTAQVVQGNTYVHDQTGKIITGNALSEKQTAQIITGNAVQDVIKNIDALNTSYTADMLSALVNNGAGQSNSLLSIFTSSQTIISLLGKLVSLTQANEQAKKVKEIEMNKAEYLAAITEREAAYTAYKSAKLQTAAAEQTANIEASQYGQANQVAAWMGSIYANNPTEANAAELNRLLAIADAEYAQYAAAQSNLNTLKAQEAAALSIYNETISSVQQLKDVANALIAIYNQQYPNNTIPSLAYGGIATGPESGYEATLHGTELVVSPKNKYPVTVEGKDSNVIMISELRALRSELKAANFQIAKNTLNTADLLDKFDNVGMPTERTK